MAEAKLLSILKALGIPLYIFAWAVNMDNIKGTILFIVALATGLYRFYRWAINSKQNAELKEIQIEKERLELDKMREK